MQPLSNLNWKSLNQSQRNDISLLWNLQRPSQKYWKNIFLSGQEVMKTALWWSCSQFQLDSRLACLFLFYILTGYSLAYADTERIVNLLSGELLKDFLHKSSCWYLLSILDTYTWLDSLLKVHITFNQGKE